VSTVLLLGFYGIANTPLFYRYKHALDIPTKMFTKRKWIHGKIVAVVENEIAGQSMHAKSSFKPATYGVVGSNGRSSPNVSKNDSNNTSDTDQEPEQRPITVLFRHSSPVERLLTQSAMDKVLSFTETSPSRTLDSAATSHLRNMIPTELAGIAAPPSFESNQFHLIHQLIEQKAKVSLQLITHRTAAHNNRTPKKYGNLDPNKSEGRRLPMGDDIQSTVIGHLHYRKPDQWFTTTNASLEMVKQGQGWINSFGMVVPLSKTVTPPHSHHNENETVVADFNPTVKQLHSDTDFMSRLEDAEYSSWESKVGMWHSDHRRHLRQEYVEKEEQVKNQWSTGVWTAVKRSWAWWNRRKKET